jgi:uncharacterized iron-regulated protein
VDKGFPFSSSSAASFRKRYAVEKYLDRKARNGLEFSMDERIARSALLPCCALYSKEGKETTYGKMADHLAKADVVLFGELHNNPIVHWLQLEVTKDLFEMRKEALILGAEMFEADDQVIVNEYLSGTIEHEHLVREAKVWDNYDTDYRPLMDFANGHGLRFIATNIPRRYANLVAREGMKALEGLSEEAKRWIAPLPVTVDLSAPGYREMMEMGMAHGMQMEPENFVAAQAVKDATMAYFIIKNLSAKGLFIHYHGDFHSQKYSGIYWYLKKADRDLRIVTISSVEGKTLEFDEEYRGLADFILVIPDSMTRTY